MASLPTRVLASFQATIPVPSLNDLDGEFNQYVGAFGIFNGGTTGTKLLVKSSDGSDPPLEIDQIGAGPLAEWKQNGTLKVSINNAGQVVSAVADGTAPLTLTSGTVVTNLNADKLDGKHAAEWTTLWSATFQIPDPAARGVDADFTNVQGALIAGANITCTHIEVIAQAGTDTGAFIIGFRKHPFGAASLSGTLLGQINYNTGLGSALGVGQETDIADHTFTAKDYIFCTIDAVSAPLQKSVWCTFRGFQTLV